MVVDGQTVDPVVDAELICRHAALCAAEPTGRPCAACGAPVRGRGVLCPDCYLPGVESLP